MSSLRLIPSPPQTPFVLRPHHPLFSTPKIHECQPRSFAFRHLVSHSIEPHVRRRYTPKSDMPAAKVAAWREYAMQKDDRGMGSLCFRERGTWKGSSLPISRLSFRTAKKQILHRITRYLTPKLSRAYTKDETPFRTLIHFQPVLSATELLSFTAKAYYVSFMGPYYVS